MPNAEAPAAEVQSVVMVADSEILVRAEIAGYLRHCGYRVIEAANADEAVAFLLEGPDPVNAVLIHVQLGGNMDGFGLAQWIRGRMAQVQVILAGTAPRAAQEAAELCDKGPTLSRPYEPQLVVDRIRRLLALRTPIKPPEG